MQDLNILKIACSIKRFDISLNIASKSLYNILKFKFGLSGYDTIYFSHAIVLVFLLF